MHTLTRTLALLGCLLLASPAAASRADGQGLGLPDGFPALEFSDSHPRKILSGYQSGREFGSTQILRQLFSRGGPDIPIVHAADLRFEVPNVVPTKPNRAAIFTAISPGDFHLSAIPFESRRSGVVPEPTTASLLGLGLVGLALRSRNRRAS